MTCGHDEPTTWLTNKPTVTPAATDIIRSAKANPLEYRSADVRYVWLTPPPCAMPDWWCLKQFIERRMVPDTYRHQEQNTSDHRCECCATDNPGVYITERTDCKRSSC